MTSTVATLARAAGIEDPGRVADGGKGRPDPEVPERARRRTFTAKYKLEILAAYDGARALTAAEQQAILDQLHGDRFVDVSPAEVWATLLDEGVYL